MLICHDQHALSSDNSASAQVESLTDAGEAGAASVARLHMVDLAGSERQARTGAVGERLREAGASATGTTQPVKHECGGPLACPACVAAQRGTTSTLRLRVCFSHP